MNWDDFLGGLFGGTAGNIISGIGGAAAQQKIIKDVEEAGKQDFSTIFGQNYQPPAGGLIGQAQRATEFKPFTVTTPTGTGSISSSGALNLGLTPEQQAMQQQLSGFTTGAFDVLGSPEQRAAIQQETIGMLTQDPMQRAAREQDIFGRMQATLAPEQERARLGLEERLANQGRLGVRTAMFGGTPEQLALEKAIAEQQAGLGVSAMEQARAEQALQSQQTLAGLGETRARLGLLGELGLQGLGASYLPQQQLLAALQPSLEASRIGSALQSTGAGLQAQLAESGLEAQLGYNALANALRQQQFQGLFDLLKGEQASKSNTQNSGLINIGSSGFGFNPNSALGKLLGQ
jgi:hypothetical protein